MEGLKNHVKELNIENSLNQRSTEWFGVWQLQDEPDPVYGMKNGSRQGQTTGINSKGGRIVAWITAGSVWIHSRSEKCWLTGFEDEKEIICNKSSKL